MKKHLLCSLSLLLAFIMCACGTGVQTNLSTEAGRIDTSVEENGAYSSEETSEEDVKKLPPNFGGLPYSSIVYTTDISTLNESNPWNADLNITELPVFENRRLFTKQEALSTLHGLAAKLNLTESTAPVDTGYSYQGTYKEGVIISVYDYGNVQIHYAYGLALPDGYSFDGASREAAEKRLGWLTESYAKHFGINEAVQCVEPCYNEKGDLSYSAFSLTNSFANTFIYPKGKDEKEDVINYYLYPVKFFEAVNAESIDDIIPKGTLGMINAYVKAGNSTADEYPVISTEEAKRLLLEKKCYCPGTLNLDLLIKEEAIGKVELVYNRDTEGGVCMPFYCFWLKSPDEEYAYYSCYVPAVEEQYLDTSDIPSWS